MVALTNPMSANILLSAQSASYQHFSPTGPNLSFQLPNPATVTPGWVFTFKNLTVAGAYPVQVLDFAGNICGWVLPGATVPMVMESNTNTLGGVWRVETGNRANDNGFYEWGATFEFLNTGVFGGSTPACMGTHMLDAELGIFSDIAFAGATASPAAFRLKDATLQIGPVATTLTTSGGSARLLDTCNNGANEVLIGYCGSTQPTVASYTINPVTLAMTLAANKTGATKTGTSIGMDPISSGNNILTYTESTTNQAWIAMITGNGAGLTHNTAVALSATTPMVVVQVAALSGTLAHTIYSDSTSVYINRVSISGTIPTPGTQSVIPNRPIFAPPGGAFITSLQIVKLNATQSLAVYSGKNSNGGNLGGTVYANIISDTGSSITQNEFRLTDDFSSSIPTKTQGLFLAGAYKGVNGSINCLFTDSVVFKLATIKVVNGNPVMSPMIDIPLRGQIGQASTNFGNLCFSMTRVMKTTAGNVLLPILEWTGAVPILNDFTTAGVGAQAAVFNPICIAPQ
ncbi:MAG TPA: hypothetical protein VIF60_24355 [Burkholderiaceae bacterium]|jgi:hypothetical protein